MEKNNYLKTLTEYLQNALPQALVDEIAIHPGKTGLPPIEKMRENANTEAETDATIVHIYTLINEIEKTEIIETEQNDITLQGIIYLSVLNKGEQNKPQTRLKRLYTLLEHLLAILNNQRWQLLYTFPASDITATDLYGLSYDSDKLVASEGWDPTIQTYAKDLYQTNKEEKYPKNLTLWFVSWRQKLRIGKNIFV